MRLRIVVAVMAIVGIGPVCRASAAEPAATVAPWRVGLAKVNITPKLPMPMVGYGPRVSEGVLDELYAKAMAVRSPDGARAVMITADLLFFRRDVSEAVAARIAKRTGLARHQILLFASHTHSGPIVGMNADLESFSVPAELRPRVAEYTATLEGQLAELAAQALALAAVSPARLEYGVGQSDIPMNRRLTTPQGVVMAPNPAGPVDRSVPVLRVSGSDGKLRGLIFGCAAHPVTLGGENRKLSGDYAGLAQAAIEKARPGVQAMFVPGCAADANSHPRGTAEIAADQGRRLAAEVLRVADGKLAPLSGPFAPALAWMELPLEHDTPAARLESLAKGPSTWHARSARAMLQRRSRGEPNPKSYRTPLAVWRFGESLTLVGLPGEAVCDYATQIAARLAPARVWAAAYANESFGYLPTAKILAEGGHESMCLTLDTGLFAPAVESYVLDQVVRLAAATATKPKSP